MRGRTTAATLAVVAFCAFAGCLGGLPFGGQGGLTAAWHSDTPLRAGGSHHPAAVARFGGETYVAAGFGDVGPNRTCAFAVTNATGSVRWNRTIPRDACGTQPAGDPTFGDVTGDGRPEVVWATREGRLYAANPATGALAMKVSLPTEDVFVAPVIVHHPTLVVVPMMNGHVRAYRPNGSVAWSRTFANHLRGQEPAVVRTATGTRELLLGTDGALVALDPATGRVRWRDDALTRFVRVGRGGGRPVVVTTGENANGTVDGVTSHVAAYAPNGTRLWRHALPETAAVGAVGRPTPAAAPLAYVTDNHGNCSRTTPRPDGSAGTAPSPRSNTTSPRRRSSRSTGRRSASPSLRPTGRCSR